MNSTVAVHIRAPSKDVPTRQPQLLAGTGTTEASNPRPIGNNHMGSILVGDVAVRVAFRGSPGVAATVDTTDPILAANSLYTWTVDNVTRHVYVEAADGAAVYAAWVWDSSI